jgi:hypothetical protein
MNIFPIEEVKKRKDYLHNIGVNEPFKIIKGVEELCKYSAENKKQLIRDYYKTEDGKKELFEARDLDLIIEMCEYAKNN